MRSRVPAGVVIGVAVLLTLGAGLVGSAGAGTASTSSTTTPSTTTTVGGGRGFARQVLAAASVPPGGVKTTAVETLDQSWESGTTAPDTPGVNGLVDLHELFLYDEPATSVVSYVRTHLPTGARITSTGAATNLAENVTVTLPVAGQNEYLAMLEYTAAPIDTSLARSELRVDALTDWVAARPADELVPSDSTVVVTGFGSSSAAHLLGDDPHPVRVTVRARKAKAIIRAFDALRGAAAGTCHENAEIFAVAFEVPGKPSVVAQAQGCAATLSVTRSGMTLEPLSDGACTLLDAVAGILPTRAAATRSAAAQCRRTSAG